MILYELTYEGMLGDYGRANLEYTSAACLVMMIITLGIRYDLELKVEKSWGIIAPEETFLSTGKWKKFIVEIIVNLVTPNIFLRDYSYIEYNYDYDFEIVYKVNEILLALSFCRLYLLVEFIIELTKYSSQRAHRACHMKGIDISFGFAIKCLNQEYPATMLFSSLFLMVLVTGY